MTKYMNNKNDVKNDVKNIKYNFTAIVEKRNSKDYYKFGYVRILLRNVRLNGNLLFREHLWIREHKQLKNIKNDSVIYFEGSIGYYLDHETMEITKLKINKAQNIKIIGDYRKLKIDIKDAKAFISNKWFKELL